MLNGKDDEEDETLKPGWGNLIMTDSLVFFFFLELDSLVVREDGEELKMEDRKKMFMFSQVQRIQSFFFVILFFN